MMLVGVGAALVPLLSFARPTSPKQAERVVRSWLAVDRHPLQTAIGSAVREVLTFADDDGQSLYHIVYLNPRGFVIVGGDDLVEPVIGFAAAGRYTDALDNPLGALVKQDVPARVRRVRAMVRRQGAPNGTDYLADKKSAAANRKWSLLDRDSTADPVEFGLPAVSDLRVAPLLQTRWSQQSESGGNQCYNLYTPNNYPCGCVATAFAQIMRFFEFPTTATGTTAFAVTVDGVSESRSLQGGDGAGGAYEWSLMDFGPFVDLSTHRTAIGRLTQDAGISVNMSYEAAGSGADTLKIADAIVNTFGYSNAVKGFNSGSNLEETERNHMVNPNLDAGYPVAFGITGDVGGHAIVGDGYGYNSSTLYHHLNMGWSGDQDAWYNLPNIDEANYGFTSVYKCVYNMYPDGSGEIISGRVTDRSGNPISGATVTALRAAGGSYSAVTNVNGIYALSKIPSASTYQVSVSQAGYIFNDQTVSTLTSTDLATVGNRWGVDFVDNGSNPVNFTASPQTAARIDLSWALNSAGDAALVAWSADGTFGVPVDGTLYAAGDLLAGGGAVLSFGTNTSFAHTGLAASTTYSYRAWSYDGVGYSSGTTTEATTACPPSVSSFPWSENFASDLWPAQCWAEYQLEDVAGWHRSTVQAYSTPGAAFHADNDVLTRADDWLVSPAFDFSRATDITLTFQQYQHYSSYYQYHAVKISTDSDGTPGNGTWTEIYTGPGPEDSWQAVGLDLSPYAGQANVHFAFQYTGDYADEWWVDDVSITATVTPPVVSLPWLMLLLGGSN